MALNHMIQKSYLIRKELLELVDQRKKIRKKKKERNKKKERKKNAGKNIEKNVIRLLQTNIPYQVILIFVIQLILMIKLESFQNSRLDSSPTSGAAIWKHQDQENIILISIR